MRSLSIKLTNLLVCCLIIFNVSHSQTEYFSKRYDLLVENNWDGSHNLMELEDGYMIGGVTGHEFNPDRYIVALMKISKSGEKLWTNVIGDTISDYFDGSSGSLIKAYDNHYAFGGTRRKYNPFCDYAIICKLDSAWNPVWIKEYGDSYGSKDTTNIGRQLKTTLDSGYVLTGEQYYGGSVVKSLLIKTDFNGNKIWEKAYGPSNFSTSYSVVQTSDSGFALGGFWYIPGSEIYTGDPIVIKTDSLGNQQWLKNLGEPIIDNKAVLCLTPDSYIVAGTTIGDSLVGGTVAYSRINIVKLDNEGNILWNQKYCEHSRENYLVNIRCLEDGSLIATGSRRKYDPVARNRGWILKVDADGDSLWYREYLILEGGDSQNYLDDVIPTSDSGFLTCGTLYPILPDTGTQDAWVLKVDSLGCDTAGCDPTVGIAEDPFIAGLDDTPKLEIWPNPARERVWVSLRSRQHALKAQPEGSAVGSRQSIEDMTLTIYDIWGRKVLEKPWPQGMEHLEEDVGNLPDGLYLCVLYHGQEQRLTAKLLVNHD